MQIKVEVNGLVYDSQDKACKCILTESQGKVYAFLQVLDGSFKKQYWGEYSHAKPEASVRSILLNGGKWPSLPH